MNDCINKPIYTLAITWVLLLPLLFFVARGTFSFDRTQSGSFSASEEDALNSTGAGSTYYRLEQVCMYVIVVAAVYPSFHSLRSLIRENALVFLLPSWALISTLWSQSLSKTLPFGAFTVILTVFGVYLSHRFSPEMQVKLFLFVGWFAIILSVVAALLYPPAGIALSYGTGAWRGIWIQKNHCGIIATLLVYAAFCVKPKSTLQRCALTLFVLMASLLVIMSQSRTAWIVLGLSLCLIVILNVFQKFRYIERLLFALCLVVIVAVTAGAAVVYASQISVALGKDPSASGRTQIFRAIVPELWKRPLVGFGYRAFWLGMKGESGNLAMTLGSLTNLGNAENGVLELWLDLGIIGVSLALLTFFQACRNALTCLNHGPPKYILWYVLIIFFNLLSLADGDKIMFPHTIEWLLFVVAYVGLSSEARRIRSQRAE